MQSLRAGLEADIDQVPESGVEAACAVGFAVVAVAFVCDSRDHLTEGTSAPVASEKHFAGTVAVAGKRAVPSDHSAQKIRSEVVQSQEVEIACCSAVRAGPSFEAIVGTVAEVAGEQVAALWGGAGEATLAV